MQDATFYSLIRLDSVPQSIPNDTEFVRAQATQVLFISINVCTDWTFDVSLQEAQDSIGPVKFGPVQLSNAGALILCITIGNDQIKLFFNGQEIPKYSSNAQQLTISLLPIQTFSERAINHPDAQAACLEWINWREKRFGKPAVPENKVQRVKTLGEQLQELRGATAGLVDLVDLAEQGRTYMIDHIASSLRALLCWDGGKKMQPLLLRMASRVAPSCGLPVFAFENNDAPLNPILRVQTQSQSIIRVSPQQKLMDIQQWLETSVRTEDGAGRLPVLTAKELILRIASESAAAHYSEFTYRASDHLFAISSFGQSTLYRFFIDTAKTTILLSNDILEKHTNSI